MNIFSERLKTCREKKKDLNPIWTQSYAADKVGVARTTYTAYENGTKTPPLDTVNIIADLFDVSTDYLLGRTNTPATTPQENDEAEFLAFINDPELGVWYKELPNSSEEELRKLRTIWEMIKNEQKK